MFDSPAPDPPIDATDATDATDFTATRWSLILRAVETGMHGQNLEEAVEWLCQQYWRPVHLVIRRRGYTPEDALDLAQGFFAMLIERPNFHALDPARGRFRAWMLGALHHYLINCARSERAQKRNLGQKPLSLEGLREENAVWEPLDESLTPDQAFDRQWALNVLERGVDRTAAEYAKRQASDQFEQLRPFLTTGADKGDYAPLAMTLGVSLNNVAVAVSRLRERFRAHIRQIVAETVTSEEEISLEMQHLMSALKPPAAR